MFLQQSQSGTKMIFFFFPGNFVFTVGKKGNQRKKKGRLKKREGNTVYENFNPALFNI